MELLRAHLGGWRERRFDADAGRVARAMMTTDTVAKTAVRRVGPARVVGMAKGVGMIEPHMATMLAFVLTDAAVDAGALERLWRRAVDETFNCLSVDTDTSTSDTAVVLANGAAGPVNEAALAVALREVCLDLTLQLARDGEGATKLLTVTVRGAPTASRPGGWPKPSSTPRSSRPPCTAPTRTGVGWPWPSANARTTATSTRSGSSSASATWRPTPTPRRGRPAPARRDHGRRPRRDRGELGDGPGRGTVYGCDLSDGYVRINADYTT